MGMIRKMEVGGWRMEGGDDDFWGSCSFFRTSYHLKLLDVEYSRESHFLYAIRRRLRRQRNWENSWYTARHLYSTKSLMKKNLMRC